MLRVILLGFTEWVLMISSIEMQMIGLLRVTMSEYSSILNFSSGSGTSHADWKNTLEEEEYQQLVVISLKAPNTDGDNGQHQQPQGNKLRLFSQNTEFSLMCLNQCKLLILTDCGLCGFLVMMSQSLRQSGADNCTHAGPALLICEFVQVHLEFS